MLTASYRLLNRVRQNILEMVTIAVAVMLHILHYNWTQHCLTISGLIQFPCLYNVRCKKLMVFIFLLLTCMRGQDEDILM
jgi:ABC-type branched-subunit amino acid transport system permease subunit